jgi:hypothetical protein
MHCYNWLKLFHKFGVQAKLQQICSPASCQDAQSRQGQQSSTWIAYIWHSTPHETDSATQHTAQFEFKARVKHGPAYRFGPNIIE